jgi:isoquinoline 1-oxidoreductase beta subunit
MSTVIFWTKAWNRRPQSIAISERALQARVLQAGAAAGGGLVLSLSLPFANGEAEAAGAAGFAPNAFIRIGDDGHTMR